MKAKTTFRSLLFLGASFIYTATIKSQNEQITITRTDEKGQTETTVRPFDEATKIDLDQLLKEAKTGQVTLSVCKKEGGADEKVFIFKGAGKRTNCFSAVVCDGKTAEKTEIRTDERGFLGVEEKEESEGSEVLAVIVQKGGAAEKAGLRDGDAILFLDDQKINGWADLTDFMRSTRAEQTVKITFFRSGKTETIPVILEKRPAPKSFAWHEGHENWSNKMRRNDNQNWPKKEACLGVFGETAKSEGAEINAFVRDGAAEPAGLQIGDIVTAIDGVPIKNYNQLYRTVGEYEPGAKVKIDFVRGAEKGSKMVVLKACDPRPATFKRETIIIQNSSQTVDNQPVTPKAKLELEAFSAFPNPTDGLLTVRFSGAAEPTILQLLDAAGRELFREELNGFDGRYEQQFDLSRAARGPVVVSVRQGEKAFSEQIILN